MKKSTRKILLGLTIVIVAIWIPSYIIANQAERTWQTECIFATGLIIGITGFMVCMFGAIESCFDK